MLAFDEGHLAITVRMKEEEKVEEMRKTVLDYKANMNDLLFFSNEAKASAYTVSAENFVRLVTESNITCIDVRSPAEFARGFIPCKNSLNLPLFTNDERHKVGVQYKREGKGPAMLMGMRMVAPKLNGMLEIVRSFYAASTKDNPFSFRMHSLPSSRRPLVAVHCWRGGMRSASVAWWLRCSGFDVVLLKGGYKAYREWALNIYTTTLPRLWARTQELSIPCKPRICIVGGRTGSGKTRILHAMKSVGAQVLDLEGLANHRGSAFGWIAQDPQPTSEQFMNDCANIWNSFDTREWIFVEDEGPAVGKCSVPPVLYTHMRGAPLVVQVVVPMEARLQLLVEDYSGTEALSKSSDWQERIIESIERMVKRLGGDRTKAAVDAVISGNMRLVAEILIMYYDKLYDRHIANEGGNGSGKGQRSGSIVRVEVPPDAKELDAFAVGAQVLQQAKIYEEKANEG